MAQPTARVYYGTESPGGLLAATYDGAGDSADISVELFTGQVITVVFEGGDPGDVANVAVYGEEIAG